MDQIYFIVVSACSEILRGFKHFLVCRHTNIGKIEMIPNFDDF